MTSVMVPRKATTDDRTMKPVAALPLVLSSVIMAAHFYRGGQLALVLLTLVAPLLVITRELTAIRIVQLLLILGAAEWIRTAYVIAQQRAAFGAPVTRMLVILGGVALLTLLAALPLPFLARRTAS